MELRPETDADHAAVRAVIEAAFGRSAEADLVTALRRAGDVALALVALSGGAVVGHVVLSPMTAPVRAVGLAPLSVLPAHQRQGVGAALVRAALRQARSQGWQAVFLLGDPAYYGRFGFRARAAAPFDSPYAGPYFQALELVPGALAGNQGTVAYAPAFAAL